MGRIQVRRKILRGTSVLVALALVLVACGGDDADDVTESVDDTEDEATDDAEPEEEPAADGPDVERVVFALPPPSPETNRSWLAQIPAYVQHEPYLESLLGNDPETGETIPSLAVSWEISDDLLEWTFQLREGVQFHHGWGEFTSADVVHSYELWADPESPEIYQPVWETVEVEATDTYEVVFRFSDLDVFAEDMFNRRRTLGHIYSKAQFDQEGVEGIDELPAGTGTYMYMERALGEYVRYERNPDHWSGTLARFPEMEFRWEPEGSTRVALLASGEAHIAEVARELHPQAVEQGLEIIRSPTKNYQSFLIFGGMDLSSETVDPDLSWPWIADERVRGALNLAINREEIIEFIYEGDADPLYNTGFANSGSEGWNEDWVADYDEYYGYDPERALELIREAGYEPEDLNPTLMVFEISGSPEWGPVMEAVQLYLGDIGVTAEILETDFATFAGLSAEKESSGYVVPLRNTPIRRPQELFTALIISGTSPGFYATDELDAVVAEWRRETEPDARQAFGQQAGDILFYEWGTMPLAQLEKALVVRPDVVAGWTFPGLTSSGLTHFELIEPAS